MDESARDALLRAAADLRAAHHEAMRTGKEVDGIDAYSTVDAVADWLERRAARPAEMAVSKYGHAHALARGICVACGQPILYNTAVGFVQHEPAVAWCPEPWPAIPTKETSSVMDEDDLNVWWATDPPEVVDEVREIAPGVAVYLDPDGGVVGVRVDPDPIREVRTRYVLEPGEDFDAAVVRALREAQAREGGYGG